ncbi:MAG: hypothetical protein HC822_01015 [Oscillochloris sp.]|nr:hypothetical protein [Oscillochloris sp.]
MISLLWPYGTPPAAPPAPWVTDLTLESIIQALSLNARYAGATRAVLSDLCRDLPTITARQELLADLLAAPELAAQLEAVLPDLAAAALAGTARWADEDAIFQIAGRLRELESYIGAIKAAGAALDAAAPGLTAAGWRQLQQELAGLAAEPSFRALEAELPQLRAQLDRAASVTLGINLDPQLRPQSATLISINPSRFNGPRSLFGRIFGGDLDGQSGLSPLRSADERQAFGPDRRLFLDLAALLENVTTPIAEALTRYARLHGAPLARLEAELAFLLGAARFVQSRQEAGLILTRPSLAPPEARLIVAEGLYNLELALRLRHAPPGVDLPATAVPNDIAFDDTAGRIFILTGPNRGGKTTYMRAIGQAVVLAQAGLPLPASSATISPVRAIFTLFPAAERAEIGKGRLDEEAAQLATIVQQADAEALVLLNEPLGSTSPREATTIAGDVLCGLRMIGARAILVTHVHELAYNAAELNRRVTGPSTITTLVAGASADNPDHAIRTYQVTAGLPDGRSYAADIALAHGLHLEQIEATLRARGIIDTE